MEYSKLPTLDWLVRTTNHRRSLETVVGRRGEIIRHLSLQDGTGLQNFFFNFDVIPQQLTCGVLGK